ncbi:ACP S-malonyltransferase [Streptomyces sp. NBC_01754]|uniref:ACP S-malonyltransferase n=1 Tax=Streptomyces sp. NBC_01754 TaxID=2975930 RepID=UPI002DD92925|nr:ACP S-malonyltransferase [Streptomyces sp. NBC_01754]WSC94331.1 ACP S-malonyltransferase [Streptomyces sp. NBC_01754]
MSTRKAVIFPGMGPSRFEDVGKFMVTNRHARELVALADDTLGYSLVDRYREAEGDYSEPAQIAFLVNCLAVARWATDTLDMTADYCTGPSFGGKAAAVHAGALSARDAIRMTAGFARCMDEYFAEEYTDVVTHSFARTPQDALDLILGELREDDEWFDVSCHVDHDFTMLSLREGRLEWLQQRLRSLGGLPLYTLRPPMHSAAFGALRRKAEEQVFADIRFSTPALPVVSDHDGTPVETAEGVRSMLLDGFVRPVRWPEVVGSLRDLGVGTVYVAGQDALFGRVGVTTGAFEVTPLTPQLAMRPRRRFAA